MNLKDCYNFDDFKKLAKKNLPAPIFHYIDGGSDDEVTLKRNTESFSKCDLVPSILTSVGEPDLSKQTVFGKKINIPFFYHQQQCKGYITMMEIKLSARAAEKFGTFYSMSTMATSQLKKFQMFLEDQKCFNYIFIKIKVSQTILLIDVKDLASNQCV